MWKFCNKVQFPHSFEQKYEVSDLLKSKCSVKNFNFINQSNGWTLSNSAFDFLLFYLDGLHLVAKGNLRLGKSILKAADSNNNANPYKNTLCFNVTSHHCYSQQTDVNLFILQ